MGPGAEVGEELDRASLTSSFDRGTAEGFRARQPLQGSGFLGGKKWSSSALLMATGWETPRTEWNLGVLLGVTSCLAVHILFEKGLGRRSPQ